MKTTLLRVLHSPLAYPAALLLAAAFLIVSELSYEESVTSLDRVGNVDAGRMALYRLRQQMSDAESGQRGYLLTGRTDFLEPYQAAVRNVDATRRLILDYYTRERPQRLETARELSRLATAKMSELETSVQLHVQGRNQAWQQLVASGIGKEQMDRIHDITATLLNEEGAAGDFKRGGIYRTLALNRLGIGALTVMSVLVMYLFLRQANEMHRQREEQRLALEAERDLLERTVTARTQELRELAQYLQWVREDEKGRLARELHDELGALLTAAKLDVARLKSKLAALGAPQELRDRLEHLRATLNDGISLKRRIIEDLRPSSLSNLGLVPALEALLDDARQRLGVELTAQLEDPELKAPADLTVYRFVQEALTNTAKHAKAATVRVVMRKGDDHVHVEVSDDGVGFDVDAPRAGHHGLTGLHYRVEALGGRLAIYSAHGQGTTLRAELPNSVEQERQEPAAA